MFVNYDFFLTGGLLKKAAPSRIVCVSSCVHRDVKKFDPEDMKDFKTGKHAGFAGYKHSKLCNVYMASHMAKKLKGTG